MVAAKVKFASETKILIEKQHKLEEVKELEEEKTGSNSKLIDMSKQLVIHVSHAMAELLKPIFPCRSLSSTLMQWHLTFANIPTNQSEQIPKQFYCWLAFGSISEVFIQNKVVRIIWIFISVIVSLSAMYCCFLSKSLFRFGITLESYICILVSYRLCLLLLAVYDWYAIRFHCWFLQNFGFWSIQDLNITFWYKYQHHLQLLFKLICWQNTQL